MSIAEDESKQLYPDQYWPHHEPWTDKDGDYHPGLLKHLEGIDTDYLQEAYEQGRTAPITDEEVEEAAKAIFESDWYRRNPDLLMDHRPVDEWPKLPEFEKQTFRDYASAALLAARKRVAE